MTNAHRVIPRDAVHRPCVIAPPTSPSACPVESALTGRHTSSIPGVGTIQRASPAAIHAIARSNLHAEPKKCESLFARCACKQRGQHKLHAHSSAVGSSFLVAGKLFQLRNHNDTKAGPSRSSPKRHRSLGR